MLDLACASVNHDTDHERAPLAELTANCLFTNPKIKPHATGPLQGDKDKGKEGCKNGLGGFNSLGSVCKFYLFFFLEGPGSLSFDSFW